MALEVWVFVCVIAVPQFICLPQRITALFRGLERSEMKTHFRAKTVMSCLTAGGPDKEHSPALKATGRIWKEATNLPGSLALESILAERCMRHPNESWARPSRGQARQLARDNPETNSYPIRPKTASPVAEQFSLGFLTLLVSARGTSSQ